MFFCASVLSIKYLYSDEHIRAQPLGLVSCPYSDLQTGAARDQATNPLINTWPSLSLVLPPLLDHI